MPYYQGDFYQGDYYQGDPFFGSLFGKIGRVIGGITGLSRPKIVAAVPAAAGAAIQKIGTRVGTIVSKHPVLSAAGAAGTIGILGGGAAGRALHPGMAPKGFHLNKHGKLVKNRRMRVTNPRALRRALRRVGGFSRICRRVMHFTHPRSRGRMVYKFRRKKRAA